MYDYKCEACGHDGLKYDDEDNGIEILVCPKCDTQYNLIDGDPEFRYPEELED